MTSVQRKNTEHVGLLSADFQLRYEPNFAIGNAISTMLALPELRGLWPFSSINESGNALDISGQGRTLTNNATTPRSVSGLVPHIILNGTTRYFSRADEAGLDITGAMTLGGWFSFSSAPSPTLEQVIGKRGAAGTLSYYLRRNVGTDGYMNFGVSVDGTASVEASSTYAVLAGSWTFLVGKYIPSTQVSVYVNGDKFTNAVGVPAAVFNSASAFAIGATATPSQYMPGTATLCFLCAAALPDAVITNLYEQTRSAYGV